MRCLYVVVAVLLAVPAAAQVQSRPTSPPIVTAENENWYRAGQPIPFGSDFYVPAGPTVFFNGNTMVRTGNYNGIPLYADTTLEPFSVVFVPIGRGLMQPYERPRRGELEGTTGSRTPSFPVGGTGTRGAAATEPAAAAPIALPTVGTSGIAPAVEAVGTTGVVPPANQPMTTAVRPRGNDGVWVRFNGQKWVSSGPAVPLDSEKMAIVGEYAGFPVFALRNEPGDVIYLPTRPDIVAPYTRKP